MIKYVGSGGAQAPPVFLDDRRAFSVQHKLTESIEYMQQRRLFLPNMRYNKVAFSFYTKKTGEKESRKEPLYYV